MMKWMELELRPAVAPTSTPGANPAPIPPCEKAQAAPACGSHGTMKRGSCCVQQQQYTRTGTRAGSTQRTLGPKQVAPDPREAKRPPKCVPAMCARRRKVCPIPLKRPLIVPYCSVKPQPIFMAQAISRGGAAASASAGTPCTNHGAARCRVPSMNLPNRWACAPAQQPSTLNGQPMWLPQSQALLNSALRMRCATAVGTWQGGLARTMVGSRRPAITQAKASHAVHAASGQESTGHGQQHTFRCLLRPTMHT